MATTKVITDVIDMSGNTGGLTWVKGTTAQRTTTNLGDLRANTETNRVEIYTDQTGTSEWRNLKEEGLSYDVNFLVVGGGGAGGASGAGGGGGGAGGLRTSFSTSGGGGSAENPKTITRGTAYTITVGAGGAAINGNGYNLTRNNGEDSVFDDITSKGGGGGSAGNQTGADGGSGGGGNGGYYSLGGAGETNQGYAGGRGTIQTNYGAGGGGGAGAAGVDGANGNGGAGGAGIRSKYKRWNRKLLRWRRWRWSKQCFLFWRSSWNR